MSFRPERTPVGPSMESIMPIAKMERPSQDEKQVPSVEVQRQNRTQGQDCAKHIESTTHQLEDLSDQLSEELQGVNSLMAAQEELKSSLDAGIKMRASIAAAKMRELAQEVGQEKARSQNARRNLVAEIQSPDGLSSEGLKNFQAMSENFGNHAKSFTAQAEALQKTASDVFQKLEPLVERAYISRIDKIGPEAFMKETSNLTTVGLRAEALETWKAVRQKPVTFTERSEPESDVKMADTPEVKKVESPEAAEAKRKFNLVFQEIDALDDEADGRKDDLLQLTGTIADVVKDVPNRTREVAQALIPYRDEIVRLRDEVARKLDQAKKIQTIEGLSPKQLEKETQALSTGLFEIKRDLSGADRKGREAEVLIEKAYFELFQQFGVEGMKRRWIAAEKEARVEAARSGKPWKPNFAQATRVSMIERFQEAQAKAKQAEVTSKNPPPASTWSRVKGWFGAS